MRRLPIGKLLAQTAVHSSSAAILQPLFIRSRPQRACHPTGPDPCYLPPAIVLDRIRIDGLAGGGLYFLCRAVRPESDALSAIAWDAYLRFIHFNLISVYEEASGQLAPDPILVELVAADSCMPSQSGGWLLVFVCTFFAFRRTLGDHRDGSALNQPNSIGADEPMSAEATSVGVGD